MPATAENPAGVTFDAQPTTQPVPVPPNVTFDQQPTQQAQPAQQPQQPVTFDQKPLDKPTMLESAGETWRNISGAMEQIPQYGEAIGAGKEAVTGLGGLLNIITEHAGGVIPKSAQAHMKNAAEWLKQQGELRGWDEPGGMGEHMGAMGADYLGYEGLSMLLGGAAAAGVGGASKVAEGSKVVRHLKNVANLGEQLDKYPLLKQAVGIGLRTIHEVVPGLKTAATAGTQSYIISGGNKDEAEQSAILSGVLHMSAGQVLGPLGEYLASLKREAGEAAGLAKPLPPPLYTPAEPRPTAPTPELPPEREPAAARFGRHEQQTAQEVTGEQLEDLNQYRKTDERGTPTNIQQLGLPSRSATEPYQFRVPGWSATTEAGDLLHEAGARYQQAGTRVVEGKGKANLQPWEAKQAEPFDLPRYAEEPGAVFKTERNGQPVPLEPAEPIPAGQAAEPPSSPFSHKEPIMRATEYKTSVRPGSEIRQDTTRGGPDVLTTDPEVAAAHLNNIETIVQDPNFSKLPVARQADILQSRNDVMQQIREHQQLLPQHEYSPYLHQPTFEPLDVDTAMARVGDMGDSAEELMKGPKEMYNRWQELTRDRPGGSFQDLNEEINDLQDKTGRANRQRLAEAQAEMARMFNGSDPHLGRAGTLTDLAIARAQFNNGYLVKRVDNAFTNAWEGANRTGDFNVSKLQSNWKSLVNKVGEARMSNTLGAQRYEAMNNIINDLAGEPAADTAATKAAKEAAKEQHGAAVEDWKTRETERKKMNEIHEGERDRQTALRKEALTKKQKWYYDLSKNGWHHIASKAGLEAVANIAPRGMLGMVTAKVGAALILKQIVTHPLMAELAYKAAQLGTNPEIYAPVIADMIHSLHKDDLPPVETPAAEESQPVPKQQTSGKEAER